MSTPVGGTQYCRSSAAAELRLGCTLLVEVARGRPMSAATRSRRAARCTRRLRAVVLLKPERGWLVEGARGRVRGLRLGVDVPHVVVVGPGAVAVLKLGRAWLVEAAGGRPGALRVEVDVPHVVLNHHVQLPWRSPGAAGRSKRLPTAPDLRACGRLAVVKWCARRVVRRAARRLPGSGSGEPRPQQA